MEGYRVFSVWLGEAEIEELRSLARLHGGTASGLAREMIEQALGVMSVIGAFDEGRVRGEEGPDVRDHQAGDIRVLDR